MNSVYIIAIAGPSCAGKTELSKRLATELSCPVLLLDSYYRDLSSLSPAERARVNFDEPSALDEKLLIGQVHALSRGKIVPRPIYDFATHTRIPRTDNFVAFEFLIIEGLFALYWPELRQFSGTKVFVNASDELCLRRRLTRDVVERGRTRESVTSQFHETVQPMATRHVRPTSIYADLVLSAEQPISKGVVKVLTHVQKSTPIGPRRRSSAGVFV